MILVRRPARPDVLQIPAAGVGPRTGGGGPRATSLLGRTARTGAARLAAAILALGGAVYPVSAAAAPDPPAAPVAAGLAAAEARPAPALLYFFSPDWRPPDLGRLAVAMEDALRSGAVDVSFQAFTKYEDFDRQAREQPPDFLIAPAWLKDEGSLAPSLSPTVIVNPQRHGKNTYRKALMTRPGFDSMDDLARGSVAATIHSMSEGSPAVVLEAFHLATDSAKVVPVPKDVDALLALSFGQVDAALVTSEQYEQFARSSPAEAEKLRVLAFSPEVRLPPVYACSGADPAMRDRLRDVLVRLAEVPRGAEVLELLAFDAFVAPSGENGPLPTALPAAEPAAVPATENVAPSSKTPAPAAQRKAAAPSHHGSARRR